MTIEEAVRSCKLVPISGVNFDGGSIPDKCEWFAFCTRIADYMRVHAVMEWVPVCEKHAVFDLYSVTPM